MYFWNLTSLKRKVSTILKGVALGLNPEISKFNRIAGEKVATPLATTRWGGVNETEAKVQRALMYYHISKVLKLGAK